MERGRSGLEVAARDDGATSPHRKIRRAGARRRRSVRLRRPAESGWSTSTRTCLANRASDLGRAMDARRRSRQPSPKVGAATGSRCFDVCRAGRAPSGEPPTTSGCRCVTRHLRRRMAHPVRCRPPDVDGEARQAFKALADGYTSPRGQRNTVCVDRGSLGPLAIARSGRDIALAAGPYEHDGAELGRQPFVRKPLAGRPISCARASRNRARNQRAGFGVSFGWTVVAPQARVERSGRRWHVRLLHQALEPPETETN